MITIYGMSASGNCHKLRLLLEQLGREYAGSKSTAPMAQRAPRNTWRRIRTARCRCWSWTTAASWSNRMRSSAISPRAREFLPADAWQRAQALSWMFFEQYSHEPYIAVARFIRGWTPPDSPRRADLPRLMRTGRTGAGGDGEASASAQWFTGADYGVADIALFAYTDCAERWRFRSREIPAWFPLGLRECARRRVSSRCPRSAMKSLPVWLRLLKTNRTMTRTSPFPPASQGPQPRRDLRPELHRVRAGMERPVDARPAPGEAILDGSALDAQAFANCSNRSWSPATST